MTRAFLRKAREVGGKLGLIVVDYLQLMSGTSSSEDNDCATELGEISQVAKAVPAHAGGREV